MAEPEEAKLPALFYAGKFFQKQKKPCRNA